MCVFCLAIAGSEGSLVLSIPSEDFIVLWDNHPSTPGHALVIPRRHVRYLRSLNLRERASLIDTVIAAKEYIRTTDLTSLYQNMLSNQKLNIHTTKHIEAMIQKLSEYNHRPPDDFNDGINDGAAAGQSVPHFHWHIMPRWHDTTDPRGGVRHMFPGLGVY